jgi:hypothetical protein
MVWYWGMARSMQSGFVFDTVRSATAMGTFRSMEKDLVTHREFDPSDRDDGSMYGMPQQGSFWGAVLALISRLASTRRSSSPCL